MDLVTFSLGVLGSVLATGIAYLISISVTYAGSFPSIKGEKWIGSYKDKEGVKIAEEVVISQQFLSKFRGTVVSSVLLPHSEENMFYKFKGKFVNRNVVAIEYWPANNSFTDFGVALYTLDLQHNSFVGHSVSFSRHTGNVFPHSYKGERQLKA